MENSKVGISEIGIVLPEWFIESSKMAEGEQLPLEYVNGGLGLIQARIPYDISLEELVVQALKKIKYNDVERFIFASESDYDLSKAAIAINSINNNLKLTKVPFQLKFACLAGIQALILASEYSLALDKPSVVIVADRSIYGDKKAEVTQGSGVIAMRIEKNPRLLALDIKNYGQYAESIDDFKIPVKTAPVPEVDGPLTKPAYIKCIVESFKDYKKKNQETGSVINNIDYLVMHTPFPKMVVWASAALWHYEKYRGKAFSSLLEKSVENPEFFGKFKELLDEVRNNPEFQNILNQKIKPGLRYNSHIGNCYNVSVFISLIGALEEIKENQEVLIIGYGSGSGSIALKGMALNSNFKSDLDDQIKQGKELSIVQYHQWRNETLKKIRGN
jgi:3-hydroxy-3-methylglutaryl CoA synthase